MYNGLRYLRVGGVGEGWEQEKLEARKMPVNRADSHTSGARGVGRFWIAKDSLPKEDRTASMIGFLHATKSLTTPGQLDLPKYQKLIATIY